MTQIVRSTNNVPSLRKGNTRRELLDFLEENADLVVYIPLLYGCHDKEYLDALQEEIAFHEYVSIKYGTIFGERTVRTMEKCKQILRENGRF